MLATTGKISTSLHKEVIKTLCYFDIFYYPLTIGEIEQFLQVKKPVNGTLKSVLDNLVKEEAVFEFDGFYSLHDKPGLIQRRKRGNQIASHYLKRARLMSRLIGGFPFVRGVFISGSLSKGYIGKDADVDYFVITKPGRLWLSRTLLILFKKVFLLNSRKYFCLNYFIDDEHLEIEEKNIYTAVELSTLIPTYNKTLFEELKKANSWTTDFLPNHRWSQATDTPKGRIGPVQRFAEWLLGGSVGNGLEKTARNKTVSYWKKKFSDFDDKEFAHALKSKNYVSKHHPQNFQKKVLSAYSKKTGKFTNQLKAVKPYGS